MKTSLKSLCVAAVFVSAACAAPLCAATVSVLPTFGGVPNLSQIVLSSFGGDLAVIKPQLRSKHHLARTLRLNVATRFAKGMTSKQGAANGGVQFAAASSFDAGGSSAVRSDSGSVAAFLTATGPSAAPRGVMFSAGKTIKALSEDDSSIPGDPILVVDGEDTTGGIDMMPPSPVPLPGAAGLMLMGLMALGAAAKARRT